MRGPWLSEAHARCSSISFHLVASTVCSMNRSECLRREQNRRMTRGTALPCTWAGSAAGRGARAVGPASRPRAARHGAARARRRGAAGPACGRPAGGLERALAAELEQLGHPGEGNARGEGGGRLEVLRQPLLLGGRLLVARIWRAAAARGNQWKRGTTAAVVGAGGPAASAAGGGAAGAGSRIWSRGSGAGLWGGGGAQARSLGESGSRAAAMPSSAEGTKPASLSTSSVCQASGGAAAIGARRAERSPIHTTALLLGRLRLRGPLGSRLKVRPLLVRVVQVEVQVVAGDDEVEDPPRAQRAARVRARAQLRKHEKRTQSPHGLRVAGRGLDSWGFRRRADGRQ